MTIEWRRAFATACMAGGLGLGCGNGDPDTASAIETVAPATVSQQQADGRTVFAQSCSTCHGAGGEGSGRAPRLVGLDQGALAHFQTAEDMAQFVRANMPLTAPGSLGALDAYAVVSFLLDANGVSVGAHPLDEGGARALAIRASGGPAAAPSAAPSAPLIPGEY